MITPSKCPFLNLSQRILLKLVSVPTKRSEEGIAYSSRNEKLTKKQLQDFVSFHQKVENFLKSIEKSFEISTANQKAKDFIVEQDIEEFDYFEFRNNDAAYC